MTCISCVCVGGGAQRVLRPLLHTQFKWVCVERDTEKYKYITCVKEKEIKKCVISYSYWQCILCLYLSLL